MRLTLAAVVAAFAVAAAQAQPAPQPNPAATIAAVEQQRNVALTWHAQAEARATTLAEEVARLNQEISRLQAELATARKAADDKKP